MIALVLVGVVSLAIILVLNAFAPDLRSGNNGGEHALSRSSTGYAALPVLLRARGVPVILSRSRMTPASEESLLIVTPPPGLEAERLDDLTHEGSRLVVLPKWAAIPEADHQGWVRTISALSEAQVLSSLPESWRRDLRLVSHEGVQTLTLKDARGRPVGETVSVEGLHTLAGPQWVPVVLDQQGRAVLVFHRDSGVYVLSDPDLVSTHGLKTLAGARTAVALIDTVRPGQAPVIFDLTLHGLERSHSLLRLLMEPPLLGFTLALVALAAFAGSQALVRFGPVRDKDRTLSFGKRALADNTAGLVRLARREHHMALPYARLVRARVARAIGAPRHLPEPELDAFLDRVSRSAGATTTYTALAERARAARNPRDLMQVATDLHRWNQELTRDRK
ncbi:DUF4350 domain-containing protein [Brevundimonas sp.]|uniref:DUF4350 domain-containing protein n=1 Tax=Brevundimonas sp. TaxID=1871086 RepID=UPI003AF82096